MFKSVLLTNLDWSRLLHIGHVCRRVFMERYKVDIYKNAKRTRPISAADPGKGPGRPPPPLCLEQKMRPERPENLFLETAPPYLKSGWLPPPPPPPPPYLKVWICHCISCYLDRTRLVNKRFITWPKRKGFSRTSGRRRQAQSEHRICLTLPLAQSAIYN